MAIRGYIPPNHGRGRNKNSRKDRRKRQDMFNEQKGLCHWCKTKMQLNPLRNNINGIICANNMYATFEHILPRANGGTRDKSNIVLAHACCNRKRAKRKWEHDPYRDHWKPDGSLMDHFLGENTNGFA